MTSDNRWFTFDAPKFEIADEDKFVYRYIPFDSLLQMLTEECIILVQTDYWDDVYENFILKENYYRSNGKKINAEWLSKMFLGQCWTGKKSSDAMWRIYSPDKKGLRIRTRIGKIMNVVKSEKSCFFGQVEYLPQAKIEKDLASLKGNISMEQLAYLMLESQFIKRNSFSHESEYRIIKMRKWNREESVPIQKISIDPLSFIENVCFDPRADLSYVDRCKNILVKSFGYPINRIKQSSLYSFAPLDFTILDK